MSLYTSGAYLEHNADWHAADAPWKARQVRDMLRRHDLRPERVVEVGSGSGVILTSLATCPELAHSRFTGYEVSPQAHGLACRLLAAAPDPRVRFACEDVVADPSGHPLGDLLLLMDVIEHVPDYLGFLAACRTIAPWTIFHIPLDLHVSSLLRNAFVPTRHTIGHLHYFTRESALATLADSGYTVIDHTLTNPAAELFGRHPSLRRAVANVPRALVGAVSRPWSARLFGGYSLLVLAR